MKIETGRNNTSSRVDVFLRIFQRTRLSLCPSLKRRKKAWTHDGKNRRGGNEESVKWRREEKQTAFQFHKFMDPHPGKLVWWCLLARLTGVDKMAWKILRTRGAGRKRGRDGRASNRRKVGEGVSKLLPSLTRPYFHRYYSIGKKRRKIKDRALTVDSRRFVARTSSNDPIHDSDHLSNIDHESRYIAKPS